MVHWSFLIVAFILGAACWHFILMKVAAVVEWYLVQTFFKK